MEIDLKKIKQDLENKIEQMDINFDLDKFPVETVAKEEYVKILNISLQYTKAVEFLNQLESNYITFFGSARFSDKHAYYHMAQKTAAYFAQKFGAVMTGGNGGIMEAVNRGAKEIGAYSYGCNITLPKELEMNAFISRGLEVDYFFIRKLVLIQKAIAIIVFPGGFGTMDEVFESITLMQTGKIKTIPVFFMGVKFWENILPQILDTFLENGTIEKSETSNIFITDSSLEITMHIKNFYNND